jgi:hypothetical protein
MIFHWPFSIDKFLDIAHKYLNEASLHGFKYLNNSFENVFEKVFWSIAVVSSWAMTVLTIYTVRNIEVV